MAGTPKGGWLKNGYGDADEDFFQSANGNDTGQESTKSVMVYLLDRKTLGKEPLGIILERRKSERDGNNAIGMLHLARKEFGDTEDMEKKIIIGDYI